MLKKIGIGIGVLILIVAGASWFLFSNLDSIVKAAIEKYGSEAAQTSVSVSGVKMSLSTGEGSISSLKVGSPKGFSAPQALSLGEIKVKIDTSSLTGTGPIIIDEISINQPQVTYEVGDNGNNLQTIQKNAQEYAAANAPSGGTSSGPARKIIINDFAVRDGTVGISATALKGKGLSVPLPPIHLTNIGRGSGGATPAQVAEKVLGAISSGAAQAGAGALAQQLSGAVSGIVGGAASGAEGVGGQLKGLFGK